MALFRQQRGSLDASMETVKEVKTLDDVWNLIDLKDFGIKKDLSIKHYCYDKRINWNTFIISNSKSVIGFSNQNLK